MKPDKSNWKEFCQESTLTDEEVVLWNELASEVVKDDDLMTFMVEHTEEEWDAAYKLTKPTDDWSDMVEWADANRRLQRAEIRAWKEWKEKER